jgi:HD-GYP domain-containing protein (c-di-GMP phosphodiesterase class II)
MPARYDHLALHSKGVLRLVRHVARGLGLRGAELRQLELGAVLHDVGKIGIPDSVLLKPGPLDRDEWALMRCHPAWGADLISAAPGLGPIAEIALTHHERWDGLGYPAGLRAWQVPQASRVIAVCDAFDAMISERSYRPALSPQAAVRELRAGAGTQFDPEVVAVFDQAMRQAA